MKDNLGGFLVPNMTVKQLPSPGIRARMWRRLAFALLHISKRIDRVSIWCDMRGHYSERCPFAGPLLQMVKEWRERNKESGLLEAKES